MLRIHAARQFAAALAAFLASSGALSHAQATLASDRKSVASGKAYPIRPILLVVPASPGSVTDIVARMIGHPLAEALGQPVIVDVKERFLLQGYETVASTPEQFGAWIRAESVKWGKVIRDQGITFV